jgi:hypothetical protein
MLDLPVAFKKTIVDLYDERGQEWLQELPGTISAFEERWSIRVLPHFKGCPTILWRRWFVQMEQKLS